MRTNLIEERIYISEMARFFSQYKITPFARLRAGFTTSYVTKKIRIIIKILLLSNVSWKMAENYV